MNYTFDGIMARLQKGDSIETIGNEFAEMLNLADSAHKAEVLKNERAKVEAANKEARMCILQDIVALLADYAKYADVDLTETDLAVDLEEFDRSIMSMLELVKSLEDLKSLTTPKVEVKRGVDADDVIRKFLAAMG